MQHGGFLHGAFFHKQAVSESSDHLLYLMVIYK